MKNSKIRVQRRTNITQSVKKDWEKLDVELKGLSQRQEQFKKNLELFVQSIFKSYKENGFRNDKNLKLLKSFYLIRNLLDQNGNFIKTMNGGRENIISFVDGIIDDILKTDFELKIDSEDSVNSTKQKRVSKNEVHDDIIEITKDLLDEYWKEHEGSEQQTQTDSTQKEIDKEIKIQKEKLSKIIFKRGQQLYTSIFGKATAFIRKDVDNIQLQSKDQIQTAMKVQELSFIGTEQKKTIQRKRYENIAVIKDSGKIKNNKQLDKLGKGIKDSYKNDLKRQDKIQDHIKDVGKITEKIGKSDSSIFRKTIGILNPLTLIKKIFSVFSITGIIGFVGSAITSAIKVVTSIAKGIWTISKKIVTSILSLTKSVTKKLLSKEVLSFLTTPSGAFIAGYVFGKIYHTMKEYGVVAKITDSVNNLIEESNSVFNNFLKNYGPDMEFLYLKMKRIDFSEKTKNFISLIYNLLKSFTVEGMIKSAVKHVGAKAIGGLAWTAIKGALYGLGAASMSTGVGFFVGLGLMALGAVAELGMMFWESWTEKQIKKSNQDFKDYTQEEHTQDEITKLREKLTTRTKHYGSRGFLESNFGLFTLFKQDGKTPKEGLEFKELDKKWLSGLIEQLKTGRKNDVNKEQRKIEIIQEFFNQKLEMLEKERQEISNSAMDIKSKGNDVDLENLFYPTIPLYVDKRSTGTLKGLTENPIGARIENVLFQYGILKQMYYDKDIIEKYGDNPKKLDEDYTEAIMGHFKVKEGVGLTAKNQAHGFNNTELSIRQNSEGEYIPITKKGIDSFSNEAQSSVMEMNLKIQGKISDFKNTPTIGSRSNFKMFNAPPASSAIIMQMVLGQEIIDYNFSTQSYQELFYKILYSSSVVKKLKERKIDMDKKKLTTWREYIGLWVSQNQFIEKFDSIFNIRQYLSSSKVVSNGTVLTNGETNKVIFGVNIHKILNGINMAYFLNNMKYNNPTSIPYKLDKNFYISNPRDFYPDNLFYIDSNAKSYMHLSFYKQEGSPIEFLEIMQPAEFKEKYKINELLQDDLSIKSTNLDFRENNDIQLNYSMAGQGYEAYNKHLNFSISRQQGSGNWVYSGMAPRPPKPPQLSQQSININKEKAKTLQSQDILSYECSDLFDIHKKMMSKKMERGQLKIGVSTINTYSNVIIYSKEPEKHNPNYTNLAATYYYVNNLELMVVKPDDELTKQTIDRILQNFVDFIYPFLKNYFDNIDKFDKTKATVNDYSPGIVSDIKNFIDDQGVRVMDSLERLGRRTFGGSDRNPRNEYEALRSDIKKQDVEKQKYRLQELEGKLRGVVNEIEKQKGRRQVNEKDLENIKKTLEQLKKRKEKLLGRNPDGKGGTVVQAAEIVKEKRHNLAELRRKSEDRRESRC